MKVKRFVVSCLLAGSLLGVFAGAAGAAANPDKANCVGQFFSSRVFTGQDVAAGAREFGGIGQFIGPAASSNCETR